jgi:AraC-like DNA-binding protein
MEGIFKIRDLSLCTHQQAENKTAFRCYEVKSGYALKVSKLPLNYLIFVLDGLIELSCDAYEGRIYASDEMAFMPVSSLVKLKALNDTRMYVMYFDVLLSRCDRHFFKTCLPDVVKITYDFTPVAIPRKIRAFLEQLNIAQADGVDCMDFNFLKHGEIFILLRHFCPREDLVSLFTPLILKIKDFRAKVLEMYARMDGGNVSDLADLMGMGRKNFDKYFRREFDRSPAHWMQEEKAKRLRAFLREPEVTIIDAMDKFHFSSASYFNRFCRKFFGETPLTIIKQSDGFDKFSTDKR